MSVDCVRASFSLSPSLPPSLPHLNIAVLFLFLGHGFDPKARGVGVGADDGESVARFELLPDGKSDDRRLVLLDEMTTAQTQVPRVTLWENEGNGLAKLQR